MRQKVRKIGIRLQILIPAGLLALVICVLLGLNAYMRIETGMVALGVEQAEMAANVARAEIDGDLLTVVRKGSEGSAEYELLLTKLREIQEICGIAYLYTLYTDGDGGLFYGIDTDHTSAQARPGDHADMPYSEFADAFAGKPYVQDYIDETEDGSLISAYLPVWDSEGRVAGILGCDYDASYVADRMGAAARSTMQISAFLFVTAILVLNLIAGKITRRLQKVDKKIYDLVHSEGDLTQKLDINSGDELELIAGNVNTLLEHIREIMLQISANSDELNQSAESVVNSLAEAKDSISDVSATMEEMSAAMEETSASICQVNESVSDIDSTVVSIAEKAIGESRASGETAKKVQEIYSRAETDREDAGRQAEQMSVTVNEKIERSRAVKQIGALTEEIISITDQTSLLALNANIEAARAGEAGRGFAVVAGEIGSLAGNSAKAAEEIQRVSQEVITAVNELAEEAENMIRFMNETAMAGYEMLLLNSRNYQSDVNHLSRIMKEFAEESQELRGNIDNIKEAVESVHIAVEESAKGVVNVTEVSSDLTRSMESINEEANGNRTVAKQLGAEVGKFKLH